jgi:purine-binding chemotaxis protein CheW
MDLAEARHAAEAVAGEYLTYRLGEEEYAIDILKVQEIRGYDQVTRIAGAPEFVKGVMNLRGTIVPIVDLRLKFGLGEPDYGPFTVVVILNFGNRIAGAVVDAVSDVIALSREDIRPAPDFEGGPGTRFIRGLAPLGERMVIVADIEALMTGADMHIHETAAA